ncbi:thioredoxin-like protein [Pisolithus tinctorius]|nr:thioredoxin-like protein [Pisolithus tinctorius]
MAPPDANLHPVATGRAAETVSQHQNPQDLTFYSAWFCPFSQRVWIVLEEKGIPYQYKEVNPYKKEEHFLQINPRGLAPAVEYRGKAIYESLVLLEFLEDAYPSYKPNLLPSDPSDRAHQRIWIDHIAKAVVPVSMRLTMTQPNEQEKLETARNELYEALRKLQNEIKGTCFAGERFTLVDAVIVPWVLRDYVSAEHRAFKREDVGDGWAEYAKAIETRDSVCRTMSERDKAKVIYNRYLGGDAQSEAAKAIKAGRPIP